MNIEEPTSKETSIETPTSNTSPNTRIKVAIPPLQINPDDYIPYYSLSKEEKPNLANNSIANLASKAYIDSLIKGENNSNSFNLDNKITINKPNNLIKEPKDYNQAINSYLYKEYQIKSIKKEILSLVENNTQEITSINKLDPSIKPLKARQVYKIKENTKV